MYSGLVCNLTREYLRTPGVSSGVELLAGDMVIVSSPSTNDGTDGSIIYSDDSRVKSSFAMVNGETVLCVERSIKLFS